MTDIDAWTGDGLGGGKEVLLAHRGLGRFPTSPVTLKCKLGRGSTIIHHPIDTQSHNVAFDPHHYWRGGTVRERDSLKHGGEGYNWETRFGGFLGSRRDHLSDLNSYYFAPCSFYPKTYLNSPGMSLPQGLCTCSSLCLEGSSPSFLCGPFPLSLWSAVRCVPNHTLTPIRVHTFSLPLLPTSHFLSNPLPCLLFFCSIHKSPDNACFTYFCYHLPPPNTFP